MTLGCLFFNILSKAFPTQRCQKHVPVALRHFLKERYGMDARTYDLGSYRTMFPSLLCHPNAMKSWKSVLQLLSLMFLISKMSFAICNENTTA